MRRVWGIRSLSVILAWLMQNLIVIPFALLGALIGVGLGAGEDPLPWPALALVVLGTIVAGTVVEPFLAGVVALLYVDRRMRAEGLDIAVQLRIRRARRAAFARPGPPEAASRGYAGWVDGVAPTLAGGGGR